MLLSLRDIESFCSLEPISARADGWTCASLPSPLFCANLLYNTAGRVVAGAVALVVVGNLDASIRPGELVMGGGFLGDLPHGGMTGHQAVRSFKEYAASSKSNTALQSDLAHSMMGNGNVDNKKAKAIAAAAAEIAKILKVPSARELVLGSKGAAESFGPTPQQVHKAVHAKKHALASWLKTPSNEGEFKYKTQAEHVTNGCPTCHNQMDLASAVHRWSNTPDRSAMGAHNYDSA